MADPKTDDNTFYYDWCGLECVYVCSTLLFVTNATFFSILLYILGHQWDKAGEDFTSKKACHLKNRPKQNR
jgi:hypothetical protein